MNRVVFQAGGEPVPDELRDAALADEADVPHAARPVEILELASAAGSGATVLDESPSGCVWFRREWLDSRGLDARQCSVIGVRGESMEPTLPDGCSILVDRSDRRRLTGRVYVVATTDGLVVKRLAHVGAEWVLSSDHPAWDDTNWMPGTEVVGRVRWMAREV